MGLCDWIQFKWSSRYENAGWVITVPNSVGVDYCSVIKGFANVH